MLGGMVGLVDKLPATDADWTIMAGGFVSAPSTTGTACRDRRSLVEAFVSSMTPSVRAMMYDVTSYVMNPNEEENGTGATRRNACGETRLVFSDWKRGEMDLQT